MSAVPFPPRLAHRIRSAERVLLSSHLNPDGDAIGTELALARILRSVGKQVTIWNHDSAPPVLGFLAEIETIRVGPPPPGFPDGFDLCLPLECPTLDRTGLEDQLAGLPLINIDHHLGNDHYGVVNWVDPEAPAVAEMVLRLARELEAEVDAEAATALYVGLVTDTGGFRHSNATPRAFEAAAELTRRGADPSEISRLLYERQSPATLRLLGEMLRSLRLHARDRVASVVLTDAMFAAAGAGREDSEGLINHPRSIAGVDAVALLRQTGEDEYKVSLRSRGLVDVAAVAQHHGGGGHRNAAGCSVQGPLDAVREEIVLALSAGLETSSPSRQNQDNAAEISP